MGNRGDKLRLLLKRFELRTPPQEFTDEVMKEIKTMSHDEVYADAGLKSLLKTNVSVEVPAGFTYKVLNKVREQPRVPYPPIIPKKVWGLIVVFVIVCLIVAIITERTGSPSTEPYFYISVAEYMSNLTIRFIEPLFYLGLIFLSGTLLLVIDNFFRKKLRGGLDVK